MSGRLIAIGDVHGYSAALAALVEAIDPQPEDRVVPLGDYVDRGPDSPGVIGQLIELAARCRLFPILGNHDEVLLNIRDGEPSLQDWLSFGGDTTLAAYGCDHPRQIPAEHADFLQHCLAYYEAEKHFFVHASYVPGLPLDRQPGDVLRWDSLRYSRPGPHCSGKIAIVGHTAQYETFEILDLGYLRCIDTCCYGGGWLTALDAESGRVWQADGAGRMR